VFGRATIGLGIGPHSSWHGFFPRSDNVIGLDLLYDRNYNRIWFNSGFCSPLRSSPCWLKAKFHYAMQIASWIA